MVARSSRRCRIDARKAERAKIQSLNEGIDHADRVVLGDSVLKTRRKQRRLIALGTDNKPSHASLRSTQRKLPSPGF